MHRDLYTPAEAGRVFLHSAREARLLMESGAWPSRRVAGTNDRAMTRRQLFALIRSAGEGACHFHRRLCAVDAARRKAVAA